MASNDRNVNQQVASSGYPRIEKLIETEDFDELNSQFEKTYQELEKVAKTKTGLVKGKMAAKAVKAIDLTMELFKELIKIKYQIVENTEKQKDLK